MNYDDAYTDRGGHPDLFANKVRNAMALVSELQEDAGTEAHPAMRPLVLSQLRKAYAALGEVVTMEGRREGDDYRAVESRAGMMRCPVCRGRGTIESGEGVAPCVECDTEGVLRAGAR